jgi:hypothetical protein
MEGAKYEFEFRHFHCHSSVVSLTYLYIWRAGFETDSRKDDESIS